MEYLEKQERGEHNDKLEIEFLAKDRHGQTRLGHSVPGALIQMLYILNCAKSE